MRSFFTSCVCLILLMATGCLSLRGTGGDLHRMEPYSPVTEGIVLVPEKSVQTADAITNVIAPPVAVAAVGNVATAQVSAASGDVALPVQRILSRGDRIMISLRGIPRPEEIKNVVDGLGEVTLPLIGQVSVSGLTTSEAERLIESTYIDGGFYRKINIIVVAEDKVYFVQGEVARQGKFSMSGDVTLLQAITEAGGYTAFANPKKIKVIRGDQVLFYNARDIADGKETDPPILADDIIMVPRGFV